MSLPELLVTGTTGFIGRYLVRGLAARGIHFTALVRPTADTAHLRELNDWARIVEGDITDPNSILDALPGVKTVIHAAAKVSFLPEDREEMTLVNEVGTANVVNAMLEAGVPRLVYLSSVATLNRSSKGPVVTEKDRWPADEPNTNYALSKFAAEREVWRGQAEGLSVAAVYPSTVLGAGNWHGHNTPALWRMAAAERNFYPTGTAGFVDVRDVVKALLTVVDRNVDRDRFLLNAANVSWREMLGKIAASIDARPPGYRMPAWQSSLLWPVEALRARVAGTRPLITRESHRNVQSTFRYNGSHYTAETGNVYLPIDTTIEEIGKAFTAARAMGEELPAMYLPVV